MGDFAIGSRCWPGLGKTTEEVGELLQVLGKLVASGGAAEHWDGTNLHDRLIEETGDAIGALRFLTRANGLPEDQIELRAARKYLQFCEWHQEHSEPESVIGHA